MTPDNIDIGRMNQGSLDLELKKWIDLESMMPQDRPQSIEFNLIAGEAKSLLTTVLPRALQDPNGHPIFEKGVEKLNELYVKAVELRAATFTDSLKTSIGAPPNAKLDVVLESQVDKAEQELGGFGSGLTRGLRGWAQALSVNPSDVLEGSAVIGNRFFMRAKGSIGIDFNQVDKAKKFIGELQAVVNGNGRVPMPHVRQAVQSMQAALQRLQTIDPIRNSTHQWLQNMYGKNKTNLRPFRVAGGILASLVTGLGVAQTVFSKEHSLSPATVGWGAAALALINPSLFQGTNPQTLATLQKLGSAEANAVVNSGLRGQDGAKAFEELQSVASSRSSVLKTLLKSAQPITAAQIGMLTGSANSALTNMLTRMSPENRRLALSIFGSRMDLNQKEFVAEMLRLRERTV